MTSKARFVRTTAGGTFEWEGKPPRLAPRKASAPTPGLQRLRHSPARVFEWGLFKRRRGIRRKARRQNARFDFVSRRKLQKRNFRKKCVGRLRLEVTAQNDSSGWM